MTVLNSLNCVSRLLKNSQSQCVTQPDALDFLMDYADEYLTDSPDTEKLLKQSLQNYSSVVRLLKTYVLISTTRLRQQSQMLR